MSPVPSPCFTVSAQEGTGSGVGAVKKGLRCKMFPLLGLPFCVCSRVQLSHNSMMGVRVHSNCPWPVKVKAVVVD